MSFGQVDEEEIIEEEEEPTPRNAGILSDRAMRQAQNAPFRQERAPDPFAVAPGDKSSIDAQVNAFLSQASRQEDIDVSEYPAGDVDSLTLKSWASNPDPQDPENPAYIRNSANFLFGDEMAILGVKWDKDGVTWKAETARDMWVDHPVMSAVAATSYLPIVGQYIKSTRLGGKMAKAADLLGAGKIGLLPKPVELVAKHGDNWTAIGDEMLGMVDPDAAELGGNTLKFFDNAFAEEVMKIADPEERLAKMGGRKQIKALLLDDDMRRRRSELAFKVASGTANPLQQKQYALQKMFANDYFNLNNRVSKQYVKNMNKFWDNARFDELFNHPLEEADHLPYFKYLNEKLPDEDFLKLSPEKQRYFQRTRDRYFKHQADTLDSAFNTPETVAWVGRAHTAAVNKNTAKIDLLDVSSTRNMIEAAPTGNIKRYPKLDSITLLDRKKSVDEVIEAAAAGKLIIDPDEIHKISILKDEMLHVGYKMVRDIALKASDTATSRYAIKAAAYDTLPDSAKRAWVSLDKIPGGPEVSGRLRRMIAKASGKTAEELGELPYVHQNVIEELFDADGGMFVQGHNAVNLMTAWTMAHKSAKTIYNLPSHFQNPLTNIMYCMPMLGINPLKASPLNNLKRAHKMVWAIADDVTGKGTKAENVLGDRAALAAIAKKGNVDTTITTSMGTKTDLIDELMDNRVRSILEEQAFENNEGLGGMADFLEKLSKDPHKGLTGNAAEYLGKAYVGAIQATDKFLKKTIKTPLLKKFSAAYLAEDMTPKLASYIELRQRGLSIDQAVMQIGRKFPQYKTVGRSIQGARRFMLPWITFPAEMTRIMKNNMMDKPLASFMWLQSAGMTQAVMSGIGMAPQSFEQVQEAKEGAPFWANKPTSVVTTSQGQGMAGGALAGGIVGGTAGVLTAGALGFGVGSAAGAMIGAGLGAAGTQGEDSLRSWVMDFLPHSAVLPQTYETDFSPGSNMAKEALKLSPIEPLSVMMPLVRLIMGEDEYGNEIVGTSGSDYVGKAFAQTLGVISPPWMQKYGLRAGAPNAGVFGLDQVSTMTLGGTAGAIAGFAGGGLLGGAVGGLFGTAVGSQLDVSRFEEDLGMRINSKTGERGNPIYDVLFNSMTGVSKSWKAVPGQDAFNDKLRDDNLKTFRSSLKRKMGDAAANDEQDKLNELMQDYFITYSQQYDDPRKAQAKFSASMEYFIPQLRKNPLYKRFSVDELRSRLREATAFAIKHRGQFSDQRIEDIRTELRARAMSRHKKGDAIGFDRDFNFKEATIGEGIKLNEGFNLKE